MLDRIRIAARFLSQEEMDLGDKIISSTEVLERQTFHDIFTKGCPISPTTVTKDESGNRVVSIRTRPTRYIGSGHRFAGASANIFMDNGRLSRVGRIVRARWMQWGSPLRLEFEKAGKLERARRERNWSIQAAEARADVNRYNALIAAGNSAERAQRLMR